MHAPLASPPDPGRTYPENHDTHGKVRCAGGLFLLLRALRRSLLMATRVVRVTTFRFPPPMEKIKFSNVTTYVFEMIDAVAMSS